MGAVIAWFDKAFVFHTLRFDAVESESCTSTISTSDHPIEEGADITDHIRVEAKTASIGVFVSQKPTRAGSLTREGFVDGAYTPLQIKVPKQDFSFLQGGVVAAAGRALSVESPILAVQALQFFVTQNRLEEVLKVLERLQNDGQLVECMTTPWSITNAVITTVTPSRDAGTGGGGRIQIDFKSITKAKLKTSSVPIPAEVKAKKKINLGKQNPAPIDLDAKPGKSLLKSVTG